MALAAPECKYYSDTERNLDKPTRKSIHFENFKRMDLGSAKQSLSSDLVLKKKVLEALIKMKAGNGLCNECIQHTVHEGQCPREHSCGDSKELNHKAQEHALAVGEREAALREVDDLRDKYEAKKKECNTVQCDRDVALLALKQSIETQNGSTATDSPLLQREVEELKNMLREYEVRDEEHKAECAQVKQENARIRLMYDLDRTAASREAAVLQEQLRQLARQRDEALRKVNEERKKAEKLAQVASILNKLPKDAQDTSDDSAIIEDDAPDGNSSNSDPSTLVIVQDSKKMDPVSLKDVMFTEARTISGRKVNLIVTKNSSSGSEAKESVGGSGQESSSILEGYQQAMTESPVKKVSDIVLKPKTTRKSSGTLLRIDEISPPLKPSRPAKTMAFSSASSTSSSTSTSPITQIKAGSLHNITMTNPNGIQMVTARCGAKGIFISRVCDAALCQGKNAVAIGDEIVEANGVNISGLSRADAGNMIVKNSVLGIRTNISGYLAARDTFFVRSLFDFKALADTGLSFKFGQVLQVTDVESYENGWWQACKINGMRPDVIGEVPSKERADMMNNNEPGSGTSRPSYERVRPQHLNFVRPVILMGTLTHRFTKKLVNDHGGQFSYCVRFTTNKTVEGEFLRHCTKDSVMEQCKEEGALIDCQRKKNEYYYTTREAVQDVSNGGKHCVLEDASIYTVNQLQKAGLHPIVILVKCKSAHEIRSVRNCTADQATRTIQKCKKLEGDHLNKFTAIVSGTNCDDLYRDILATINHHKDSFWLPIKS